MKPSEVTAAYWQGAREGKLLLRRCQRCGAISHPPRPLCPSCWSDDLDWIEASGRGHVVTATTVHQPPSPAFTVPYVLAIVRLAEGPQMMANLLCDPAAVRIGMAVKVTFERRGDLTIPQFVPAP